MDTSKKGSRKEPAASPEAKPAAAKKLPIKVIRVEDVGVSIFEHKREAPTGTRVTHSCCFQRSYKDAGGEWKRTQWYSLDDLGKLVSCAQQASEYLHALTSPAAESAA